MHALPAAPPPPVRRQVFVGTALTCAAGATLIGGMLALYLRLRQGALDAPDGVWRPDGIVIPEVATNIMLISFGVIYVMVQWAVWTAKRGQRTYTALALGVTALVAAAIINGQAFVYFQMRLPLAESPYGSLFYGVTVTMLALVVIGLVATLVVAFRTLGGRTGDREIIAAHALYWYFTGAAYAAVWFVIYVTK